MATMSCANAHYAAIIDVSSDHILDDEVGYRNSDIEDKNGFILSH